MSQRFEQMVTKDVYQVDQRLVNQRIQAVEDAQEAVVRKRESDQQQAANTRKWLVAVFVAPFLLGLGRVLSSDHDAVKWTAHGGPCR
ncbi:hypothetical protein ABZV67_46520 [Streptomyces sp. NPDC005065]|uniref:hypothetical protein n=1 Tax=Streptomyces sp. NPDC005065 TaxID=3154461 RepID=UPI0033A96204